MRKILAAAAVLAALAGFAPAAQAGAGADTGATVLGVAVRGEPFTLANLSLEVSVEYRIETETRQIASLDTGTWEGSFTASWADAQEVYVGNAMVGRIRVVG